MGICNNHFAKVKVLSQIIGMNVFCIGNSKLEDPNVSHEVNRN